jgi:hypothetical protein
LPDLASAPEESTDFSVSPYAGLGCPLPAFAAVKGREKGNVPTQTQSGHQAIRSTPGQLALRHWLGSRFVCVVDRVSFRQHTFVQDTGNENASRLTSEQHDVLALFHAAQADANVIAGAARRWVVRQPLATGFKLVNVADGLRPTPSAQRILGDAQ